MTKKKWEKPELQDLDIMYTLGGGEWGGTEQEAYEGGWYDTYNKKTWEEIYEEIKDRPGTFKMS